MDQNLFKEYQGAFTEKEEFPKEKEEKFFAYSPFVLQDGVGEKNPKKAWIEYNRLRAEGILAEDLIHKIVSKVRDMALILAGAIATDLSMKDFPYNKSRRDLKNWKTEDLKNFYTTLISIYHRSRMDQGEELDIALEKVLLSL